MHFNQSYVHDVYDSLDEKFNLAKFLFDQISQSEQDNIAYITENVQISFSTLCQHVKRFAKMLQSNGIEQESRVVILLYDDIFFVYSFLAITWLGAVAIIVNEAYGKNAIKKMVEDSRAKCVVTNKTWYSKVKQTCSYVQHWILIDEANFFEKMLAHEPSVTPTMVHREAEAFWIYTSGSTEHPKGVMHSHYSPVVAIENYGKHILKLSNQDVVYSAPPMAFSYGLGTSIYFPLFFRSTVLLSETSSPFKQVELFNQHKVSVFFGVPHHYACILAIREISTINTDQLRLCVSAGEQLPVALWHKWYDHHGVAICEGIGTTESTHIFISNTAEHCVPGSTGKVVPGYKASLHDEKGQEVNPGEAGLLQVSGEGFMLGYRHHLKATNAALCGQTLLTGDIYKQDEQGNFYFIGRKDKLIKVKGMWVAPGDIEQIIQLHPDVAEAAVVIQPGSIEDTVHIVSCVRLISGVEPSNSIKKSLMALLSEHLPKFKIPKKIVWVDELPRTATGKIHRSDLSNLLSTEEYT